MVAHACHPKQISFLAIFWKNKQKKRFRNENHATFVSKTLSFHKCFLNKNIFVPEIFICGSQPLSLLFRKHFVKQIENIASVCGRGPCVPPFVEGQCFRLRRLDLQILLCRCLAPVPRDRIGLWIVRMRSGGCDAVSQYWLSNFCLNRQDRGNFVGTCWNFDKWSPIKLCRLPKITKQLLTFQTRLQASVLQYWLAASQPPLPMPTIH